jgi:hypothetical protein
MRSPIILRNCRLVSHIGRAACGTGSTTSGCVPRPTVALDVEGCASSQASLRHAGAHAQCSVASSSLPLRACLRNLCPRIGAALRSWDGAQPLKPGLGPRVSRHAAAPRLRLTTAGFHGRLRVGFASFLFFPRSVGFGPTASSASGAFTIVPSILCHAQAMPSISSYSAKPRRHIFTKTPSCFHSKKYRCTELALPYSLGKAFHWHPVRSTYTIAANTRRGSMGFRPPPARRLYLCAFVRWCLGISGATRSHRASDTVHDLSVLMQHSILTPVSRSNLYLRISS